MNDLKEIIRDIENLCWSSEELPEDEVSKKIELWLKAYPRLGDPACRDLLEQAIWCWKTIKDLQLELRSLDKTIMEKLSLLREIDRLLHSWMLLLTRLGLTYTAQQYVGIKKRGALPPAELLKLKQTKKDLHRQLTARGEIRRKVDVREEEKESE